MTALIRFPAIVAQVKTLADGGIRVAFDLPETAILQAAHLMECKRAAVALIVDAAPTDDEPDKKLDAWADAVTGVTA